MPVNSEPVNSNAKRWERVGFLFQVPMIVLFVALDAVFFRAQPSRLWGLQFFDYAGLALFMWCLWRLCLTRARLNELITTGPYRYTRHPMYLGLLLMNACYWARVSVWTSPLFLGLEAAFIICMMVAGYCQERETLERFGQEAVDYYDRTPRIPLLPW